MIQTLFCPAKINLFLEVLDKRPDGYHNIDSIMHAINLCDTVCVEAVGGNGVVSLTCTDSTLPCDERNIAYKAAKMYLDKADINDFDVKIHIEKRIPVAAGLAGGSTDAAGVLLGLDRMFSAFDSATLLQMGKSLGADVPFCMMGGCARTQGIGDVMTKLRPLSPEYTFVVAKGGEGVSTKEAYQMVDVDCGEKKSAESVAWAIDHGDIWAVFDGMYNAFENVVAPVRPAVAYAKNMMLRSGALAAMMSGSGPSVFGVFSDLDVAERVCDELCEKGYQAFTASPVM